MCRVNDCGVEGRGACIRFLISRSATRKFISLGVVDWLGCSFVVSLLTSLHQDLISRILTA